MSTTKVHVQDQELPLPGLPKPGPRLGTLQFASRTLRIITPSIPLDKTNSPGDHIAKAKRDHPDDSREITCQLQKYSNATGVRDILVMDELSAIYFEYLGRIRKAGETIAYLAPTTDPAAGKGITYLSMRELVVFILLQVLDRKGVELCDTSPLNQPSHMLITPRGTAKSSGTGLTDRKSVV